MKNLNIFYKKKLEPKQITIDFLTNYSKEISVIIRGKKKFIVCKN